MGRSASVTAERPSRTRGESQIARRTPCVCVCVCVREREREREKKRRDESAFSLSNFGRDR